MPAFDDLLKNREAQGAGKKQKMAWGPVQPIRQSDRIDRSKNVMDKAMELKEKKNTLGAATKMTGIIKSNTFNVLQVDELSDMARKIGIHVDTTAVDDTVDSDSFGSVNIQVIPPSKPLDNLLDVGQCEKVGFLSVTSDCPKTPDQYNTDQEFDNRGENVWVYVTRKKRGKHPRKIFR
jgi:hypothetical protein